MTDVRALFLRQSMEDCEAVFAKTIADPDAPAWDWLVVTAANELQAEAYRMQLDWRLRENLLPRRTKYAVIPDPGGLRVGSGGATLAVLRHIAEAEGGDAPFMGKKILILHSGGDSRRIPQYSACGKLFARVPRPLADGRASTLFDEFCVSLSGMPARMGGGMLVMSGDVLLLFNALQIDLERKGAACLSIKAEVETGSRHGVFLSDGAGGVRQFLHKQSVETLRALGAVNEQGMVDIDTGAIWMDEERVAALYGLIEKGDFERFVNERVRLSFYGDFVYPMAAGATLSEYLAQSPENVFSEELTACRRAIWEALGDTNLALLRLAPAEFIHFGTTREWRDLVLGGEARFGFLGWRRRVLSIGDGIHAIVSGKVGENSVIEESRIGKHAVVGEGCVVSGADFLEGTLPGGMALHVLPVPGGYCARLYPVDANPKEGGLWEDARHPVAETQAEAIRLALSGDHAGSPLQEEPQSRAITPSAEQTPPATPPSRRGDPMWSPVLGDSFLGSISLSESFRRADLRAVLARQDALEDEIRAERASSRLASGEFIPDAMSEIGLSEKGRARRLALLRERAEAAGFPLKHRIFHALQDAACWQAINDHLLADATRALEALPQNRIVTERAEVSLPVRVNWGGGWSDTPPYCLERGGTVLNAALLLDGGMPVHAEASRLDAPVIRIISDDLGLDRTYADFAALAPGNPHDPHALCKAALAVCGVRGEGNVEKVLKRLGGGILLRTRVTGVPKGSGLGTSSILCAAVARALSRLLGQPDDDARVCALALCMEQLMSTGGGWQDQAGGLLPGVKLISTRPGTPQRLTWRAVEMPDAAFDELQSRHALLYTGQRRLARDILREIMGKAVAGNPETMEQLDTVQHLAALMAFELERGDIDRFGALLREHWAVSKALDRGSSNTCIDHMLAVCDDLICGAMICGAGGGGFLSVVLRRGATRAMLTERLAGVFQESGVRVWDAELVR